jgi:Holliday junction resolvase RusA-like endonuclease
MIHSGGKTYAHNYTPTQDPVNVFKAVVKTVAAAAYKGPPLDGPLSVNVRFVMPRPQMKVWKKRPMPRYWHTGKPDHDNLSKAFQDSLNGLLWKDDSQICCSFVEKCVAAGDEQPHVEVEIRVLV